MAITYWKIVMAILSRFIFTVHGFLLVWQVVEVKKNTHYWMLLIGLLLLYLEMVVTLTVTRKGEWKWEFSPMLSRIRLWVRLSMLSQLLLTYIGLGADILDILLLIKEPSIGNNWNVTIAGLCLFSWAILQFTLVPTEVKSSPTQDTPHEDGSQSSPPRNESCVFSCHTNEIWSSFISVPMQDGPFLIFRLYLAIKERVLNEMMIFFICKNILTVTVEIYSIAVVQHSNRKDRNK
ncbi:transmembrane protein 26-like [Mixophyes fleayi]|uniref:transmembrane protein 26-like n=1 Tax=Mixophyes fleayi TaxID=3061075 RepID=UPI003F4E3FBD